MNSYHQIQLSKFLFPSASSRFALLILNEPLSYFPIQPLVQLWLHASWRICADGGANQVFDHLTSEPDLQRRLIPHLILGDLDSLRTDVEDFYRSLGTKVKKSFCQDTTDFEKCIKALREIEQQAKEPPFDLLVLGGTKGRLDQVMSNLHTLYTFLGNHRDAVIIDHMNAVTLLGPGLHRIDLMFPLETLHCGLVPLGSEVTVKTIGLKWNLDNDVLKFGSFISTSNERLLEHDGTEIPDCFRDSDADQQLSTIPSSPILLTSSLDFKFSTVFVQCNGPVYWIQSLDITQLDKRLEN